MNDCLCGINYKQLDPQARRELDFKLRLEQTFRNELSRWFNGIVTNFRTVYAVSGRFVNARTATPQLESLLENHYRRTQTLFRGEVELKSVGQILSKQTAGEDTDLEELILLALLAWRTDNAPQQARLITGTNELQIQRAVEVARQDFAQQGVDPDNRMLAAAAAAVLRGFFRARIDRISVSETLAAAESTKLTEAQALAGTVPTAAQGLPGAVPAMPRRQAFKTWRDQRDTAVRDTHRIVNGTTVPIDQPFQVGSSRLLFPGDTSLNPQIREIINCRCYLTYGVV